MSLQGAINHATDGEVPPDGLAVAEQEGDVVKDSVARSAR
jgi:hypothetical protein